MTLQTPLRKGLHPEGAPRDPWSCANRKDPMDTDGQVPKADRGVDHQSTPRQPAPDPEPGCRQQQPGHTLEVSRMRPPRQLGEVRTTPHTHVDWMNARRNQVSGPHVLGLTLGFSPSSPQGTIGIGSQEPELKQRLH